MREDRPSLKVESRWCLWTHPRVLTSNVFYGYFMECLPVLSPSVLSPKTDWFWNCPKQRITWITRMRSEVTHLPHRLTDKSETFIKSKGLMKPPWLHHETLLSYIFLPPSLYSITPLKKNNNNVSYYSVFLTQTLKSH